MRAVLLAGLATGLLAVGGRADDAPDGRREAVIVAPTLVMGEGGGGAVRRFRSNGTHLDTRPLTQPELEHPRLSPDGTRLLAVWSFTDFTDFVQPVERYQPVVLDLTRADAQPEPFGPPTGWIPAVVWSPDGRRVYGTSLASGAEFETKPNDRPTFDAWVYDVTTKKRTPLALPAGHWIADLSPDGRTLLTVRGRGYHATETYLVPLDTLKPTRLTEAAYEGQRFSPDGRRVIGVTPSFPYNNAKRAVVGIVPVGGGPVAALALPDELYDAVSACWSPDGRRVAYVWSAGAYADRLSVADPDGRRPTVVLRNPTGSGGFIQGVDWR